MAGSGWEVITPRQAWLSGFDAGKRCIDESIPFSQIVAEDCRGMGEGEMIHWLDGFSHGAKAAIEIHKAQGVR